MEGYNFKAWIKEEEVGGKCSLPHLTDVADAAKILAVKKKKKKKAKDTELLSKKSFVSFSPFTSRTSGK